MCVPPHPQENSIREEVMAVSVPYVVVFRSCRAACHYDGSLYSVVIGGTRFEKREDGRRAQKLIGRRQCNNVAVYPNKDGSSAH